MRFVLLRRGREVLFTPLTLHWRRARRKPGGVSARRAGVPAAAQHITRLAQIHLHLGILASDRLRRDEVRPFPPAAVTRERHRVFRSTHSTTQHLATWTLRAVHHTIRELRIARDTTTHTERSTEHSRVLMPAPQVHRIIGPRLHALVESRRTMIVRTTASTHERTRRESLVSRELRVFRELAAPVRARRLAREESATPPRVAVRPPDLVWRRAAQAQSEDALPATTRAAASVPLLRSAIATQEVEPARRATRAALQAADFDTSLLDRLTDDVIRRVERRARIERERRGL